MIMVGLVAGCKKGLAVSANPLKSGRDDWIRTSGPLLPKQVRYQAALHPVSGLYSFLPGFCQQVIPLHPGASC